jgi:ABC-type sulfate/molybdate transport systems ATPase subunit
VYLCKRTARVGSRWGYAHGALTSAIITSRLLLLDEPFGALDPQVRRSLRQGLRDIIDRIGITAIFVTHDQVCGELEFC